MSDLLYSPLAWGAASADTPAARTSAAAGTGAGGEAVSGLQRHLAQCQHAQGRFLGAAIWAERVHRLVAPRFVSTISLAALVLALSRWI